MHVKPGKGAAFVRTKIKNCLTGATQDRTFRAAESVPDAVVSRREAQFTYAEGDEVREACVDGEREKRERERERERQALRPPAATADAPPTPPNNKKNKNKRQYVFMDQQSYEETRVPKDEDWSRFLKEGAICSLQFFEGKVVSVDPPAFVDLAVAECPPNVKGNTVQGGSKPATLETGAVISVPLFIEEGEVIKIDTRTGSYLSRGGKS